MTLANNSGGLQPRTPRLPALAVLLTVMLAFFANAARADCLESPYPDVRSLEARGVATLATASIRATDTLGRWGGEEFLLVLPNTTLDTAVEMLDFIRRKVAQIELEGWDMRVSISAGLATSGQGAFSLDEILARADVALYKAKNSGRNLVCYAEESFQSASTGVRRALRQR